MAQRARSRSAPARAPSPTQPVAARIDALAAGVAQLALDERRAVVMRHVLVRAQTIHAEAMRRSGAATRAAARMTTDVGPPGDAGAWAWLVGARPRALLSLADGAVCDRIGKLLLMRAARGARVDPSTGGDGCGAPDALVGGARVECKTCLAEAKPPLRWRVRSNKALLDCDAHFLVLWRSREGRPLDVRSFAEVRAEVCALAVVTSADLVRLRVGRYATSMMLHASRASKYAFFGSVADAEGDARHTRATGAAALDGVLARAGEALLACGR